MTTLDAASDTSDVVYQVVASVADANRIDPLDLEPRLNDVVDPDALERLFEDRPDGNPREGGRVVFDLAGCRVTVRSDRSVEVRHQD